MVPPLEAEEILTYIKKPSKRIGLALYSKLYVHSNVVQKKRVAWILFFKIRPSQDILKIRDGTPLEAEEILTYIKNPRNGPVWHFYSKLYVPSNVVQKKRVARILFFKIRPSQEILKNRDGTPLEAKEILTYIKKPSKRIGWILLFKIRPSQDILKIRDGTPLEAEEILTYIKNPRNGPVWHFYSNLYVPSNVVQKKGVARILFFKIRPSQEILKIHDGTPLEILLFKIRLSQEILKNRDGTPLDAEEILTYIKKALETDWPSQEILKIRDGTPLEAEEILTYIKTLETDLFVARILFFKIRPSQEILKIHDGTPLEAEEILTYIKRPSQEILKIHDGTPLEAEEILTYIKVARILLFKIRPSQEILKIRDGTPLEAEEILTYIKNPRNGSVWHFSRKLYVPSNVVQNKRVARILFFKIRPSQEILKIHDGTPLEAEEILTYIKAPQNRPSKYIDVPSNIVQKKRVAQILLFKIRLSQEILKNRVGTPLDAEEILTYIKKALETDWFEILKIRDGTPLEIF
ncbi:hypothetical protein OROHE_015220 [Orobanche hederae]